MGKIIDVHSHIFDVVDPSWHWPSYTAERLLHYMDGPYSIAGQDRRVDMALVQPTPGVTVLPHWDLAKQHEYVVESVRKHPDRLMGVMMINPHYGLDSAFKELDRLVRKEGFKAIKLHPSFHNYFPNKNKELTYPIMEKAREYHLPVIIHSGEPPFAVPALVAPVARDFNDVPIILAHFATQKICYSDDAINVAFYNDNVFLETDWGHLNRIKEGVETLGADRLIFGTDLPFTETGIGLRTIEVLCWDPPVGVKMSEADREKILGGNLAKLLGLK